jgi:hypothetical protein
MQNTRAESTGTSPKMYHGINNRRRGVRQRVHLPAQSILAGKSSGANELSGVLDLSQDGACIQTISPFRPESRVMLSLDLLGNNSFISARGVVIWSDQLGRNGIYFSEISDGCREHLKHWLFAHEASVGVNRFRIAAGPNEFVSQPERAQPSRPESKREFAKRESAKHEVVKQSPEQTRAAIAASSPEPEPSIPVDHSSVLSALVAVKREVEGTGSDLDKALQLLSDRALSLAHATGAAIAQAKDRTANEMICRARSGSDAPGLGARLQIGSGFSGECVRAGKTLRCDDAETDPLVDREGCQLLGIRSIIAVPIRRNDTVVGILEVFSPGKNSFGASEENILERLSEMIAACITREESRSAISATTPPVKLTRTSKPPVAQLESTVRLGPLLESAASPFRRLLLVVLGTALVVGLLWLIMSGTTAKNLATSQPRPSTEQNSAKARLSTSGSRATDFESLRKLAADGDPDAQFDMGARYATGEDVQQDYAESVRWFTLAAEQGHVIAQATLGAYYWAGRGIPQDLSKAYFWSAIAQAGGDAASKYRVTVLASRMTQGQVLVVQQQARDWLKKHQVPGKIAESIKPASR